MVVLFGLPTAFYAQQNWCGSDARLNKTLEEDPAAFQQFIERNIRISTGELSGMADRTDPIIIPVVVHVIHDNGIGNISYDQIVSGIDQLNLDYNRLNADTADTRNTASAPFKPLAASIDISFALAKLDPDGNCTNGVERRNSPGATYNAGENAKYDAQGGLDAWPRDKYLNIWVVNSIASDGTGGTTLGYAQFPQFADDGYGVLIRHDSYGTMGTASGDRTLTHEIGHCLGLLHTFQGPFFGPGSGNGCHSTDCTSAGDFCCDTPPATAAHWDCPATYNSCTSIPVNDPYGFDAYDQWENYMSYAPCQNMFSMGQKNIITTNLADINFLVSLVSLANQTATGVDAPAVLCQASFFSDRQLVCAGNDINFSDDSFFNVTGWSWTFEGGTPNLSSDQNPVVTYNAAGTYDVTLEVTDGVSTVSVTLTDYIQVLPDPGDPVPYKEGFESLTSVPDYNRFFVENGNTGSTWELTSTTSYTGNNCVYLPNFGVTDGSKDALISGTIDLSTISPTDTLVFFFMYAYERKTSGDDEFFKVYASKDCGETWALRKNIHGSTLGSNTSSSAYTPASQAEWHQVNITNITSDYFVSDFRYKFEFQNDGGNNMYIDNINIYPISMTGIVEAGEISTPQVYPNPAGNQTMLSFVSGNQAQALITITDALGNIVTVVHNGPLSGGMQNFNLDLTSLSTGIYFINIQAEGGQKVVKLIVE